MNKLDNILEKVKFKENNILVGKLVKCDILILAVSAKNYHMFIYFNKIIDFRWNYRIFRIQDKIFLRSKDLFFYITSEKKRTNIGQYK